MLEINIIIDTDPGTDDALALAAASVFFKNNIRAMLSTYGNVNGGYTYNNLINLANLLGIRCGIFKGALNPLSGKPAVFTDYHGRNGLCGLELGNAPVRSTGSIYKLIKEYKNIKYIAVGPLTNIAEMLGKYPDITDNISELIIMGGGFEISNAEHGAEYNFSMDGEAVRKVLESPVKKIIAPLDMTHQTVFALEEIEDITGISRAESRKSIYNNAYAVFAELFYLNYETSVNFGDNGAIIHDATTLAYLLDPGKCELGEYKIVSDEYGRIKKDSSGKPALIIERINREFVREMLKETFIKLRYILDKM